MRFIDMSRLHLPNGWLEKAAEAKRKVKSREKTINDQSSVWSELKNDLANLSHQKCWYCECIQSRSDNAVDHFRPKSLYPWLAFDYRNYRYVCTFCNSKRKNPTTGETEGKGDDFPLVDETKRAKTETDNLNLEQPILLDPCKTNDVKLLDFRDDGTPCPRYESDPVKKERVEKTIKLYHLDHPSLVEKRRILAFEISKKIEEIEDFLSRNPGQDPSESLLEDLQNFLNERSELTAFARRIIMGRRDLEWVEDLIRTA